MVGPDSNAAGASGVTIMDEAEVKESRKRAGRFEEERGET